MARERIRLVAGCMTGTSLDGLDAALVRITGTGLGMKADLLGHHALPLPDDLRTTLLSLASGEAHEPIVYMRAARAIGELHADGLERLLAGGPAPPSAKIDFVTAHGQTIWHAPRDEQQLPGAGPKSWQLFDPWPIVKRLKLPVCYDLRQADLIAGGDGAPLTPIADWVMYRGHADWVVNLGGVLNLTYIKTTIEETKAGDLGPCNLLLDGLCLRLFDERYDRDGLYALRGKVQPVIMAEFVDAIDEVKKSGSLGREQFNDDWLDRLLVRIQQHAGPHEILRTACNDVALSINAQTAGGLFHKSRLVLAGGGARNQALRHQIEAASRDEIILSDDLGIPCEAREAMAFAVLGALSQDGVPISLPQVTGATDPGIAGVWAGV